MDLKTLVLILLNQTFSENLTITTKLFLRGLHIVNCTAKLFSYQAKNVKNGKIIWNLGEFTSISISC